MTTLDILTPEATPGTASTGGPPARVEVLFDQRWLALCEVDLLLPGRGAAALLPNGRQVAVFRDRQGAAEA